MSNLDPFTVKDEQGEMRTIASCFFCPFVHDSRSDRGKKIVYSCEKRAQVIIVYPKDAVNKEIWRRFYKLHGDNARFPRWCPFAENRKKLNEDLQEALFSAKPRPGSIRKMYSGGRAVKKQSDFIDIFD
jgi:hypothetical protein